jgi:hypothetical protein
MESERQHRSAEPSAGREEKRGERESDPPAARAMAKVPQGRSAVETRVHPGQRPQVERPGEVPKSEREREKERPTARSFRSRDASKSDLLPEVFPQRHLERGRPSQVVTKLRRKWREQQEGEQVRTGWGRYPGRLISVPVRTVKMDRER